MTLSINQPRELKACTWLRPRGLVKRSGRRFLLRPAERGRAFLRSSTERQCVLPTPDGPAVWFVAARDGARDAT